MTQFHPSDPDVNRVIRSWLHEDRQEDVSRIAGVVLDQLDATPQRRTTWWPARRTPEMNKFLAIGLGAAAVVAVLLIGAQLRGTPIPGGPSETQSAAPSEAPASVEPSAEAFLPVGPFAWFEPAALPEPHSDGPPITVTIPASGWTCPYETYEACVLGKGDELTLFGDNLPESVFLTSSTTAGILVYEDPCQWEYNVPDSPATTADEIAAALAAQPSRDASDPEDVTVGGYPGKVVTLHVPDDAVFADPDGFTDCFRGVYASYTLEGYDADGTLPWRWHQGPGQIDTFWIVDVDGAIVIINAMYRADTPADRIEEMRAIAESATFEAPDRSRP